MVEDNPGDVLLVERALAQYGIEHTSCVARDGEEALGMVAAMGREHHWPDLVLLDLNLPKVDGADVLIALRKTEGCSLIPVLVMTSSSARADLARLANLGVTRYFRKPTSLEAFMEIGLIVQQLAAGECRAAHA